jgi:peptidoglycan/LPS O-acetylase OafA/YrhL
MKHYSLTLTPKNFRLDAIRGLAALLVVEVHLSQTYFQNQFVTNLYPILDLGKHGVAIFFALSGYLLANSFVQGVNISQTRRYFIRRFLRIYPAYIVCLVVLAIVQEPSSFQLTTHALLIHGFWSSTFGAINYPFWSLSVEWCYYLLLPFLALCSNRKIKHVSFFVIILSIIWQAVGGFLRTRYGFDSQGDWISRLYPLTGSSAFLVGMLYRRQIFTEKWIKAICGIGLTWVLIEFGSVTISVFSGETVISKGISTIFHGAFGYLIYGMFFILLVETGSLRFKALSGIGVASYSLYLWHLPILQLVKNHTEAKIQFIPLSLSLIALVTFISYLLVEKPFLNFSKKISNSFRDGSANQSQN